MIYLEEDDSGGFSRLLPVVVEKQVLDRDIIVREEATDHPIEAPCCFSCLVPVGRRISKTNVQYCFGAPRCFTYLGTLVDSNVW